jgi:hypothetical protein
MSCNICFDRDGIDRNCGCTAVYCDQCYDRLNECGVCRRDLPGRTWETALSVFRIADRTSTRPNTIQSSNLYNNPPGLGTSRGLNLFSISGSSGIIHPTSVTFGARNVPVEIVGNPLTLNSIPANLYLGVVEGIGHSDNGKYIMSDGIYENYRKISEHIEGQLVFIKSEMKMHILLKNIDSLFTWHPI